MLNKSYFVSLFLFFQFLLFFYFKVNGLQYFLLAECFFIYLWIGNIKPFIVLFVYFFIDSSAAFTTASFLFLFGFIKNKVKIPVKISIIFFLILYFFTARYETYLIKAVMPGFIAFVALIYGITRVPSIQKLLSVALLAYVVIGFIYSVLFEIFSVFSYQPYLMFSIDVIQFVIALTVYKSFGVILEKELPDNN